MHATTVKFSEAMDSAAAGLQAAPRDSSPNDVRLIVRKCFEGWSNEDLLDAVSGLACMNIEHEMEKLGTSMWRD